VADSARATAIVVRLLVSALVFASCGRDESSVGVEKPRTLDGGAATTAGEKTIGGPSEDDSETDVSAEEDRGATAAEAASLANGATLNSRVDARARLIADGLRAVCRDLSQPGLTRARLLEINRQLNALTPAASDDDSQLKAEVGRLGQRHIDCVVDAFDRAAERPDSPLHQVRWTWAVLPRVADLVRSALPRDWLGEGGATVLVVDATKPARGAPNALLTSREWQLRKQIVSKSYFEMVHADGGWRRPKESGP